MQLFRTALAKELFSLALFFQLNEIYNTSAGRGGAGLRIDSSTFDQARMVENLSIYDVYLFLRNNGFFDQAIIDYYLREAFSTQVWGRDILP